MEEKINIPLFRSPKKNQVTEKIKFPLFVYPRNLYALVFVEIASEKRVLLLRIDTILTNT